jgi:hypothetical protein
MFMVTNIGILGSWNEFWSEANTFTTYARGDVIVLQDTSKQLTRNTVEQSSYGSVRLPRLVNTVAGIAEPPQFSMHLTWSINYHLSYFLFRLLM